MVIQVKSKRCCATFLAPPQNANLEETTTSIHYKHHSVHTTHIGINTGNSTVKIYLTYKTEILTVKPEKETTVKIICVDAEVYQIMAYQTRKWRSLNGEKAGQTG